MVDKKVLILITLIIATALFYFIFMSTPIDDGQPLTGGDEPPVQKLSSQQLGDNIAEGAPVICRMDTDLQTLLEKFPIEGFDLPEDGSLNFDIAGTVKFTTPKMRMEFSIMDDTSQVGDFTLISDGDSVYLNIPLLGNIWYVAPDLEYGAQDALDLSEGMKEAIDSQVFDCSVTSTFSDSEFQVPADAVIKDIDEMGY